jgi:hypothetical protein
MTLHEENRPYVRDEASGNLLLWASGFGLGAMVVLLGFVVLVGVHVVGSDAPAPSQPAAKTSAAPAAPQTTGQSTSQAPAPSGTPQSR